ncbi:MAG: hypothetical protein R3D52_10660 [Xanthobacteraceae bacterium]
MVALDHPVQQPRQRAWPDLECAAAKTLGPDVDIEVEAYDECNTVIDVKATIRKIREAGNGFVGLIGVQSNQFPRAMDLARQFRAAGIAVAIGGFHVSGCLAMLPELPPDIKEALDLGITLYAGEAEGRMDVFLRDMAAGTAKPIYNYMNDLPEMAAATYPILPRETVTRVAGHYASFDAGRGCPFQCSFCTIINVQGRKSRYRTAGRRRGHRARQCGARRHPLLRHRRQLCPQQELGADPRPPDRAAREGRLPHPADAAGRHAVPPHSRLHREGGAGGLHRGLHRPGEHQSRIADGREKRQNKIWEYREMFPAWRQAKVMTYAGYILGFPTDTPESIARDIEIIKEGAAGRAARVLLPDAAAGVGRS